jgi:hypothetical protein
MVTKTTQYCLHFLTVLYYTFIAANIANLWYITDDMSYLSLGLSHEQRDAYFGFIFGQIILLAFLTQPGKKMLVYLIILLNIVFGPIMMFYFDNELRSTDNKFFNVMNYVYVVWWFIYTVVFFMHIIYRFFNRGELDEDKIALNHGSISSYV